MKMNRMTLAEWQDVSSLADLSPYRAADDQAEAYLTRPGHPLSDETLRWMLQGLLVLTVQDIELLTVWLAGNESRIAAGEESMGMLAGAFRALVGREATKSSAG